MTPTPAAFSVRDGGLIAWFLAFDRPTAQWRWFYFAPLDVRGVCCDADALAVVRRMAKVVAEHEVDECIYLDGRKPFEPPH